MSQINDGIVGMAGEVIAAVLETAGLYGQSQVLQHFSRFFGVIGALVYLWVIIGALKSVALFGNYKQALYLLIGPAFFWWMLTFTVEVKQTAHQVGTRAAPKSEQPILTTLKESGDPKRYERSATVSWFFVKYDELISNVVQQLVASLVDTRHMDDILTAARERMLHRISQVHATDKDFMQLLTTSLMGDCGRQISLSRNLGDPRLANAKQGTPDFEERQIKLKQYERLKVQPIDFDDSQKYYLKAIGIQTSDPTTCEKVWSYTRQAAEKAAAHLLQPTAEEKSHYPLSEDDWKKVASAIKGKLSEPGSSAQEKDVKAVEVLAAFYLRNSIASTIQGQLGKQLAEKEIWNRHLYDKVFGTEGSFQTSGLRMMIVQFAGTIPYFQGLLLYLLACAFPFFCVFLLMPNHYRTFFAWMGCWLWVKSWDVGFAAVVLMRKFFWEMMPHSGQLRNAANLHEISWNDPGSILNVMYQNDPSSNLNTLYLIISIFTLAIPALTAHLTLGASNLFSLVRMGAEQPSRAFANDKIRGERGWLLGPRNAILDNNQMKAAVLAAHQAGLNPGLTADGQTRDVGDGLIGRYMRTSADIALVNQTFHPKQGQNYDDRAGESKRRMDFQQNARGSQVLQAFINQMNEAYQSGAPHTNVPAIWPLLGILGMGDSTVKSPTSSTDPTGPNNPGGEERS